ncbi:MAG: peptide deformylase [bacterium]
MSVREILKIPDPLLKQPAERVDQIDGKTKEILDDLSDTTDSSPGFALAAPQIGELIRAICVDVSQAKRSSPTNHGKTILVNPEVIEGSEPEIIREGCLSIPRYTADIKRYQAVVVEGMTPGGEKIKLNSRGWEAVAFQHEIDHLEGILFLDRVNSLENDLFKRK